MKMERKNHKTYPMRHHQEGHLRHRYNERSTLLSMKIGISNKIGEVMFSDSGMLDLIINILIPEDLSSRLNPNPASAHTCLPARPDVVPAQLEPRSLYLWFSVGVSWG